MTAGDRPTRREADADAWELGEHSCQQHGHTASGDPQVAECQRCGADLTVPPEERGEIPLRRREGPPLIPERPRRIGDLGDGTIGFVQ